MNFRDNDGHTIVYKNKDKQNEKSIVIKNNVWIASYVDVLKGVIVEENSVVATRSCITKEFSLPNILIGGYPAKIIEEDITWRK